MRQKTFTRYKYQCQAIADSVGARGPALFHDARTALLLIIISPQGSVSSLFAHLIEVEANGCEV